MTEEVSKFAVLAGPYCSSCGKSEVDTSCEHCHRPVCELCWHEVNELGVILCPWCSGDGKRALENRWRKENGA